MATKKPLVLVFDSADTYPFDIKNFIYEGYPKGMHYFTIEKFVNNLAIKIKQVYDTEKTGGYRPYLSHFNEVVIEESKLDTTTQTFAETLSKVFEDLNDIKSDLRTLKPSTPMHQKSADSAKGVLFLSSREREQIAKATKFYYNQNEATQSFEEIAEIAYKGIVGSYSKIYTGKDASAVAARISLMEDSIKHNIEKELTRLYSE
jgi:hypothetical protein